MKCIVAVWLVLCLAGCSITGWYPRAIYGYSDEEVGNALIEIRQQEASGQISSDVAEEQVRLWLDRVQPCGNCGRKTVLYPVDEYGNRIPGKGYVIETR